MDTTPQISGTPAEIMSSTWYPRFLLAGPRTS